MQQGVVEHLPKRGCIAIKTCWGKVYALIDIRWEDRTDNQMGLFLRNEQPENRNKLVSGCVWNKKVTHPLSVLPFLLSVGTAQSCTKSKQLLFVRARRWSWWRSNLNEKINEHYNWGTSTNIPGHLTSIKYESGSGTLRSSLCLCLSLSRLRISTQRVFVALRRL